MTNGKRLCSSCKRELVDHETWLCTRCEHIYEDAREAQREAEQERYSPPDYD